MRVSDCGRYIYMSNGAKFTRTVLPPGGASLVDDSEFDLLPTAETDTSANATTPSKGKRKRSKGAS